MFTTLREATTAARTCTQLRTGVWYGDEPFELHLPAAWQLTVHWPQTPPPLTDAQIAERLERPEGHAPVAELCRGKSRPLVIVDDLNRPTPACRILPGLLKQFQRAAIPAQSVRILVSTGTHGAPTPGALQKKVGRKAAAECRVIIHNSQGPLADLGKTALGTRVWVNKEIVSSDFVIGLGGVYPNQTAGFGGGSKLALGVLGFDTIKHLHYRNQPMGWGSPDTIHTFRRDLDEIARMIGLRNVISLHIDPAREVIRMASGDPFLIHADEVEFARSVFTAPRPGDADVVICNAYPSDVSLTQVGQKGITPLEYCAPGASRIVLASCPEGMGHHGLFPLAPPHPRLHRLRTIARRMAAMNLPDLLRKIAARPRSEAVHRRAIWLYRPTPAAALPLRTAGYKISDFWTEILRAVADEHPGKRELKVVLYPCAPLQTLERG